MRWILTRAMQAFFPHTDALPGLAEEAAHAHLDRLDAEAPLLFRLGLIAGALAFTLSPLLTVGLPLPSLWLSAERLDLHADRAASHPLYLYKMLIFTLKMNAGLAWGAQDQVRRALALAPLPPDPRTTLAGEVTP
ncbi:MAG: hypothetical protein JXX28_18430 [Deltaproteobacteria bacterium]|nr:hypothetical protein [Deltaproteobacteria bacterium]